ncbi:serine/threonine-protein kinase [Sphingobacterium sp. SGR-19]|uniref:serine/threonine-protein kinase n=1 Tax=Sphingobacterium sp. SGR-19 TaxID=2710886 RepID=UPI0013EDB564|nr:serine/threonine-protein kinase [Sphingobacterium sp. SGR-19]NGM64187.1 serine/threonine protein kinase [Sphingobacterium sp. SGR-19]
MYRKNKIINLDGIDYLLKEQKGSGGSGKVWRAESNGNTYAIKFIDSTNQDKIARFKNEVVFCKNTMHRNIVKVIATDHNNDIPCYVMPYYSKTLRDVIDKEKDADKLIKCIIKICKAVEFIHKKGVKHRDIKPENILVDKNELVLADFGIAHFKQYDITKKNDWLANRNYMAPEQKLKNNALNVDAAADIYALGLIINECFTKQNPAGSQFKLIADSYPLFFELDNLVENMIRQQPEERISIDSVQAQIKFINQRLKQNLANIKYDLELFDPPQKIERSVLQNIYKRASEDILFGKYLFSTHSSKEIDRYNRNWHMKVGYTVSDFLYNLYVQEQILQLCKGKFEYEGNIYRKDNWYKPLDLLQNEEDKSLYRQLANVLEKYDLKKNGYALLDLSGQILKFFSSCADYHCKEILGRIENVEEGARRNLKSAPIIWIVSALKYGVQENDESLLHGLDVLGGKFEFILEEHISIDWDRTQYYEANDDEEELFDIEYLEKEQEIIKILASFQQKWKISFSKLKNESYSVRFATYKQFEKFRDYALELAKPHYIFEGDVLSVLQDPIFVGNMVELKVGRVFDIPHTIAQIIGMKEINA